MTDMIDKQELINQIDYYINLKIDTQEHSPLFNKGMEEGYRRIRNIVLWSLPAQPEEKEPCPTCEKLEYGDTLYVYSDWDGGTGYINGIKYCPVCGRKLKE